MIVGVPKETKDNEFRVSVIPATVEDLVRIGHQVLVERPTPGLNIHEGKITHRAVADALGHPHLPASEVQALDFGVFGLPIQRIAGGNQCADSS